MRRKMHILMHRTPPNREFDFRSFQTKGTAAMTLTEMMWEKAKTMKVSAIMHEYPICCMQTDTAQRAAELMKESHVGALPVVRQGTRGKVVGIVTDRDLCLRVIAEARDSLKVKVEECMTSAPVCCLLDDGVEHALHLMREYHVRRIP